MFENNADKLLTSMIQEQNRAKANHHISISSYVRINHQIQNRKLAESQLPSSMHGKVSTPNIHSRSRRLEPILGLVITIMVYAERLLLIYICRAHTLKRGLKD